MSKNTHGYIHIPRKVIDSEEEVHKDILRKKIEEDIKEFLKDKNNFIEKIPIGKSSMVFGLSKKQAERIGKKSD